MSADSAAKPQVRTLPKIPSFAAIWAVILSRPPVPRAQDLPQVVYRVPAVRVPVERSRKFSQLVQDPDSYSVFTQFAHPAFMHTLAFPLTLALMARPTFPLPLLGIVHLKNEYLQHRPVRLGEELQLECRVRNLNPHKRGRTVEAVSVFSDAQGIVAVNVATYLARGSFGPAPVNPSDLVADASRLPFEPPVAHRRWDLAGSIGLKYARLSGDANPIHISHQSAKVFGFEQAIAPGMYGAARAFAQAGVDLPRPFNWQVEFNSPLPIPGKVWVNFESKPDELCQIAFAPQLQHRHSGEVKAAKRYFHSVIKYLG